MNRFAVRYLLLIFLPLFAAHAGAQQPPAAHVEQTGHKEAVPASSVAPIAPLTQRQLFGTVPVATKSDDARKLLEKAIDQYENVLLDRSVSNAHLGGYERSAFRACLRDVVLCCQSEPAEC